MSYAGQEAEVAKAIHVVGFPPQARERLGDSYEAVLDAYVAQADRRMSGLSNAVFAAESTEDGQLISDLGERVLREDPSSAYRAGKRSGNDDLRSRAEDALLKGSVREAYSAANDRVTGYDEAFLDRIFDAAIENDPEGAVLVAGWHKDKDEGARLYGLAEKLLPTQPVMAYHVAKQTENDDVLTTARQAWATTDYLGAFGYATNGMADVELAKLAVEHSTEGIRGRDLFSFVRNHMFEREDLLDEARKRYASEDLSGAYLEGSDDQDERGDDQLAQLGLASPEMPVWSLIHAARNSGGDDLWDRVASTLSEQSGLPEDSVKSLFR
jgi:hypothetical protein